MRMSNEFLVKLKKFEGLRLKAYKCPAGVWTIGYGHTGNDVHEGLSITEYKATELLISDLNKFEVGVSLALGDTKLNQHQFDALVDFAYNCGLGNLRKSTLLKKIKFNPENYVGIEVEFKKWNKGGGKVLPGLVKRREEEIRWYKC